MTSLFAWPAALAAAAVAIPALLAIYFLRSRLRTIEVAGLFLWADAPRTKEGGRRLRRLTTPLLFFLELLALALLTIAAARPFGPREGDAHPVVLVLDDSFSMRAGDAESPHADAVDWLRTGLDGDRIASVRVILAGETAALAGTEVPTLAAARPMIDAWSCGSHSADLEKAIAFALETSGPGTRVVVITDHAPAVPPTSGRIVWKAFGDPRPNSGFIAAARSSSERGEKLLFEVKNFSTSTVSPSLRIAAGEQSRDIPLELGANEARRVSITLPPSQAPVTATLSGDSLGFDNEVTLLDPGKGEIRARVDIADARLRSLVERALEATGKVTLGAGEPVLVITDGNVAARPGRWLVRFDRGPGGVSLAGPFLVDGAHPLARGRAHLTLGGVVWGARRGPMPGNAIITAGSTPIVTESDGARAKTITIRFDPALSTLHLTPAWPVLLWNLVEWRAAELPGFLEANSRIGAFARLALPSATDEVTVRFPDGTLRGMSAAGGRATLRLSQPGVWIATTSAGSWRVAANPIVPAESDLSQAASGSWGDWQSTGDPTRLPRDLTWAALVAVLAILTAHLRIAAKETA